MITPVNSFALRQNVYQRLMPGKRLNVLLYGYYNPTFMTFMEVIKAGLAFEYWNTAYDPVGLFWLNSFNGRTAYIHFSTYCGQADKIHSMVKAGLDHSFELGLLTLFGLTPKPYRQVFKRVIEPAGFECILTEPDMCFLARYGKFVPGVLTRLSRAMWHKKRQQHPWIGEHNESAN